MESPGCEACLSLVHSDALEAKSAVPDPLPGPSAVPQERSRRSRPRPRVARGGREGCLGVVLGSSDRLRPAHSEIAQPAELFGDLFELGFGEFTLRRWCWMTMLRSRNRTRSLVLWKLVPRWFHRRGPRDPSESTPWCSRSYAILCRGPQMRVDRSMVATDPVVDGSRGCRPGCRWLRLLSAEIAGSGGRLTVGS